MGITGEQWRELTRTAAEKVKIEPRPMRDRPLQPNVHTLGGPHRGEPLSTERIGENHGEDRQ